MSKQRLKYQRLEVFYPAGTTAGNKKDHSIVLDAEMDRVVGVALYSINDAGIEFRLGLSDNSGDIQEPTHFHDFLDRGLGDYYARKKPLDFEARGRKVTLNVEILSTLGDDLRFDLVFILKNDE
jgi:hypothetical protein